MRDTAIENGGVTVSGVIAASALLRTADGELICVSRNIPFRENVKTDGEATEAYAQARLVRSSVTALGTEFSLVSIEAEAELRVFTVRSRELVLPLDAFSPTLNFSCVKKKSAFIGACGGANVQHTLRENLMLSEDLPDLFSALYASARAVVTKLETAGGVMTLEGVLPTALVYRTEDGALRSFFDDVPFAFTAAVPPDMAIARPEIACVCSVAGGSGRSAQVAYTLDASLTFLSVTEEELAVGLAEQNDAEATELPAGFSGLVMYALGSKLVGAALNQLPGSAALDLALSLIRDLASPLLLFFVFLLSYTMLPGHKVRLRSELPGALMTTVVWRGMAALYSVFLRLSLENYAYVYGALAGIVMFMLWLYACVWFWFAGAELNRWLRKRKGPAALVREHFPLNRLRGKDTGLSTEKDRPSE